MTGNETDSSAPAGRALAARLAAAIRREFDGEPELQRRARHLHARCLVEIGGERLLLEIREGRPEVLERMAPLCSWDFAIRADAEAWAAFWQPIPEPGAHDLFALCKRGAMRIEGELHPFMAHLQYFKDLVALPRAGDGR